MSALPPEHLDLGGHDRDSDPRPGAPRPLVADPEVCAGLASLALIDHQVWIGVARAATSRPGRDGALARAREARAVWEEWT